MSQLQTQSATLGEAASQWPAPYHLGTVRGTGKLDVSSRKEPRMWVVDQASLEVLGSLQLPGGEGHQRLTVQ